jgi:hypothetical protein
VNRANPRPGGDVGSLCSDSMVHGVNPATRGHTASGDMVPALRLPGATGRGVAELLLLGSPGLPSPPVN